MPASKITKFLGVAPKLSPELLPDSVAQVATNLKLYSGDLLPVREPVTIQSAPQAGTIKTIYPLVDPTTDDLMWMSWLTDVDVAIPTSLNDEEQRFYYTGDGVPKVSNYDLAFAGSGPYPDSTGYYDLGLPLPSTVPTVSAASFASSTSASVARDTGNIATIVTASAHNLRDGMVVSVTGFTAGGTETFNATNVRVTVLTTTSFSYYNQGAAFALAATGAGTISLAGTPVNRAYVYTWITPWDEESIPSSPTTNVYVREGQTITLSGLPTAPPSGQNFVRGFNIYRSVVSTAGSAYYLMSEVWFPRTITFALRVSNVATVTTDDPHNLLVGDKIKITSVAFGGTPDTSFNVTGGTVTVVDSDYIFSYASVGADKAETATSAGTLYWNIAEDGTSTSRYYESNTFIDDYLVSNLSITLDALYNDPPDEGMTGIIVAQNNIMAGFVGNELCFSEVDKPWAWPARYRLTFPYPIVALTAVSGSIMVLTERYPYLVSGSAPENMASSRIDAPYPCTSKRGVANVGFGVVYPTHGGLAVYSPSSGIDLVTKYVHDWETWNQAWDDSTILAAFWMGRYFASHSAGSFVFEKDDKIGGYLITMNVSFNAVHHYAVEDRFFYIDTTSGELREWDVEGQPQISMEWKSKVITTKAFTNIGAARVVAEYEGSEADAQAIEDYNLAAIAYNADLLASMDEFGTVNGPRGYTNSSGTLVRQPGGVNSMCINGDAAGFRSLRSYDGFNTLRFRMWANRSLVAEVDLASDEVFRLPTGYKTDTYEVEVSGTARVKAIHLGETPFSLRDV